MSEFKSFKKTDLAKVARKAGLAVRSKDTKQLLLEKINVYIDEYPEQAKDLADFDDSDDEVVTMVNDATEDEEASTDAEPESDLPEDDTADKDYNAPPPIDIKELLIDPAIDMFELAYGKVLALTDKVGITTVDINDEIRDNLSRTVTLNYLEAASEVAFFLHTYMPFVAVKDNNSVPTAVRNVFPFLNHVKYAVPDVSALASTTVLSVFANWVLYAVAVPLFVSYYVNFSRRVVVIEDDEDEKDVSFVVRLYRYDPFVFALAKVLIFYFICKSGHGFSISSYSGIFKALRDLILVHLGFYHKFVLSLGNFPIVIGLANIAIGLYSQFEDY